MAATNFKRWLQKAENDRLAMRNNIEAAQVPWDAVCFHAQQMAEKLLKAYLVLHGLPVSKTHDLVALLSACRTIDDALGEHEELCERLSQYAVRVRYPDDLFEPDEKIGREMAALAEQLREALLRRLQA